MLSGRAGNTIDYIGKVDRGSACRAPG